MFVLEYDDIELQWSGPPPPDQAKVERLIRSHLRRHVVPTKPYDLNGYFIPLAIGALVFIFGVQGSDIFYCIHFH